MKRKALYLVIAALFISNIFTLIKLNNLQRNIDNRIHQYESVNGSLRNEINNIYSNVDAKLKKQASILDSYNAEFGELNSSNFTVPVTFSLTPKQYSEGLTASLLIDDKVIPMKNEGTSFSTVYEAYIFKDFNVKAILEQGGVKKTETIEEYNGLKEKYLLNITGGFNGKSSYGSGLYSCEGRTDLQIGSSQYNSPTKITFVSDLNGTVINQRNVEPSSYVSVDAKESIKLSEGDKFTKYAVIQDSYGFNYKYIIEIFTPGSLKEHEGGNYEWMRTVTEISDKEGKILFRGD